ncbi:unnamed protein product [Ceutorhynchus assimilis]|uniref:carbonic anhydrase n=1 Tax=Ceutorhynchus assimilis TaxID=467358 RepID=A0A9N9MK55_9CUCU|nr:unnamed protein product [Ceutorhynchus assimilis]
MITTRRNIFHNKVLLFGSIFCVLVLIIVSFSVLVVHELNLAKDSKWSYHEQDKWPGSCKTGKSQSPIPLCDRSSYPYQSDALVFQNGSVENFQITNNGHTVVMDFENPKPQLSGGGLTCKFTLRNLHFHWPSEHVINGKRYPLESHLIFISEKFSTLKDAIAVPFAVTVLATLYEESYNITHNHFQIINKAIEEVSVAPGKPFATFKSLNVFDFLPEDSETFFQYTGSLTTPNCTENINWIVFRHTSSITSEELGTLTNIHSKRNERVEFNNRLLQNINQRTISLRNTLTSNDNINVISNPIFCQGFGQMILRHVNVTRISFLQNSNFVFFWFAPVNYSA